MHDILSIFFDDGARTRTPLSLRKKGGKERESSKPYRIFIRDNVEIQSLFNLDSPLSLSRERELFLFVYIKLA